MPASTLILPRGKFHRQRDDFDVLLVIHRGRFAGGADGHNAVHAALDLQFDQAFEGGFVESGRF